MKTKDIFEICPMCKGKGDILNYNPISPDTLDVVECTHCYFGVIIKNKPYKKIIKELGIEYE